MGPRISVDGFRDFALASRRMRRAWVVLLLVGCSGESAPGVEDRIPDLAGVRLERMFATNDPAGGSRFGSFDGAVEPGRTITIDGTDVVGDADGRVALDVTGPTVAVGIGDATVTFDVRTPSEARVAAVHPAVGGTGDQPNDLLVADGPNGARGIVVRSGDQAVSTFDLQDGLRDDLPGVRLPRVGDEVAAPWFIAPWDDSGVRFAVTAQKQHRLYVVDLGVPDVLAEAMPESVSLPEPFTLARPYDLSGDGVEETTIATMIPRAPQPVVVHDGRVYVGFSGFVTGSSPTRTAVYVPAVLVVWDVDDLTKPVASHLMPTMNTQELRVRDDGMIVAVSSGTIEQTNGTVRLTSEGAVDVFDPVSATFVERYPLGSFGPTSALFLGDTLWVASLARASVQAIDVGDGTAQTFELGDPQEVNSIFRLVDLGGGLLAAPTFNRDALHFIDATKRVADPAPFFAPLIVGAGAPVFDGLQVVAPREGRRGVDFVGPDLYALSGLAARVTPVELRKLLGP
jgi:hypothetical protein